MSFIDNILSRKDFSGVNPLDIIIAINNSSVKAFDRAGEVNRILSCVDDELLFKLISVINNDQIDLGIFIDTDIHLRYIDMCKKNGFVNIAIYKIMCDYMSFNKVAEFCFENKFNFLPHVCELDVVNMDYDQFNGYYDVIRAIPGYHSGKTYILGRNDLSFEQAIYGLKNMAYNGGILRNDYVINRKELEAISDDMVFLFKILQRVAGYSKVDLHPKITYDEVNRMMFPVMMHHEPDYAQTMNRLKEHFKKRKREDK